MSERNPNTLETTYLITRMLKMAYGPIQVGERRNGPGNESSVLVTLTDDHGHSATYRFSIEKV